MSSSARAVSTCSASVRSETRQLIRRSRSPGWNGRMPANSVPEPTRRDRCAPTSPSGCGASARESNGAVSGSTRISWPTSVAGPHR